MIWHTSFLGVMVPCPLRARGNKKGWGDSRKGLVFKKLFLMTTAPLLDWGNYASELLGEWRNEAVFTFLKVAGTCWNYFANWGTCRTVLIVEPYKSRNGGDDLQDYTDYILWLLWLHDPGGFRMFLFLQSVCESEKVVIAVADGLAPSARSRSSRSVRSSVVAPCRLFRHHIFSWFTLACRSRDLHWHIQLSGVRANSPTN